MTQATPTGWVSLRDVSRTFGEQGTRTQVQAWRRRLTTRGRMLGVKLLLPSGDSRRRVYRTTMSLLREHCPELFDQADHRLQETARLVREEMQSISDRVDELESDYNGLRSALRLLAAEVTALEARKAEKAKP